MNNIKEEYMLKLLNNKEYNKLLEIDNLYDIYIEENKIIHLLAIRGNDEGLDFFIKNDKDILCTNYKGQNIIHLLFKYGHDDLAEKYYKKYSELLKKFDNELSLPIYYSCDRFNNFEKCFNFMKNLEFDLYNLLNTVSFFDDNLYTRLLIYSKGKDNININYINFFKKNIDLINFDLPEKNPITLFAVTNNLNEIAKIFIDKEKGLNNKNNMFLLPLNIACSNNNLELVKSILKKDPNITYGGGESDYLPVNIAINNNLFDLLELLCEYIKDYDIIDKYRNTYAHYIADKLKYFVENNLSNEEHKLRNIGYNILKKSNIDIENIDKITVRQLLLHYIKLKKKYKSNKNRDITDIKILLENNINKSTDESENELTRNFILVKSKKHFNNGLFGSDIFYKTFYLIYLYKKYSKDISIPAKEYSDDEKDKLLYMINLQRINYNAYYNIISNIYYLTLEYLTPILVCNILWHNKELNYINPNLFDSIKYTKKRFILLTISLIVAKDFTHANCIIIDTINNDIRRFEPYGINYMNDEYELDDIIHKNCEKIFERKFKYYKPEDFIGNIKFQPVSNDADNNYRKMGDPMGYCLAWCIWYVELKLNNQDIEEKKMINLASNNILNKYKKFDNPYLYFIRDYSRTLNVEKDKILQKIKINKSDLYDINYKYDNLNKIHNYVKQIEFN